MGVCSYPSPTSYKQLGPRSFSKTHFSFPYAESGVEAAVDFSTRADSLRGDRWTDTLMPGCLAAAMHPCLPVRRPKHRLPTFSSMKRDHPFRRAAMITTKLKEQSYGKQGEVMPPSFMWRMASHPQRCKATVAVAGQARPTPVTASGVPRGLPPVACNES